MAPKRKPKKTDLSTSSSSSNPSSSSDSNSPGRYIPNLEWQVQWVDDNGPDVVGRCLQIQWPGFDVDDQYHDALIIGYKHPDACDEKDDKARYLVYYPLDNEGDDANFNVKELCLRDCETSFIRMSMTR